MATMLAFIGTPGPWQVLMLLLVVLLLFGNRLPSVMRSLGIGITEFKKGLRGEIDEEGNPAAIEEHRESKNENSETSQHTTSTTV